MKISHSFTAHVTAQTYITNYSNSEGDRQLCCFIEDGETVSLSFGIDCLPKLNETIRNLQQIYQLLHQKRQQEIQRELELVPKTLAFSVESEDDKIGF